MGNLVLLCEPYAQTLTPLHLIPSDLYCESPMLRPEPLSLTSIQAAAKQDSHSPVLSYCEALCSNHNPTTSCFCPGGDTEICILLSYPAAITLCSNPKPCAQTLTPVPLAFVQVAAASRQDLQPAVNTLRSNPDTSVQVAAAARQDPRQG